MWSNNNKRDLTLPVSIDLYGSKHEHLIDYYDLITILFFHQIDFSFFFLFLVFHYY